MKDPTTDQRPADAHHLSMQERFTLIERLNALTPHFFEQLVFAVDPPPGLVPPSSAAQSARVAALLQWAQAPEGCGLPALREALEHVVNP